PLPGFDIVTVVAAETWPTTVSANEMVVGESDSCGAMPLPSSDTVTAGVAGSSLLMVRVPLAEPVTIGAKVALMVLVALEAIVTLVALLEPKGAELVADEMVSGASPMFLID